MADEKYNPSIDLLEQGADNLASDRARRISSLHRSVSDITREQNRKRLQQSVEISALSKQQQKMMQEMELERDVFMSETAAAHNSILKGLGRTIYKLSEGVASITKSTASATANAIHQYGRAIGQDININKTNTIAMALARATPLFGYFAGKFMETDVFQNAARKIREKVGSAFHQGLTGVGEFFRRRKERKEEEKGESGTVSELKALRETFEREGVPHLQKGGFVNRGGLVEVHAAEVVTPIDKLLKQIDQARSADIAEKLDSTLQVMSQDLIRMETVVVEREKATTNVLETFMKEFREAREYEEEEFQQRLLKGVLELKVALVGMTSRFEIAWQRTLLQHPAIAKMLVLTDMLKSVTISPLKFLFARRGGYSGEVQKATATSNVFLKITNVLGLIYTGMMPKLDNIEKYTHKLVEHMTKSEVGPAEGAPEYTMFEKIKSFFSKKPKILESGDKVSTLFDMAVDWMGLDRPTLEQAGIKDFGSFKNPSKILGTMGINKKSVKEKFWNEPKEQAKELKNAFFSIFGFGQGKGEKESEVKKEKRTIWQKFKEVASDIRQMRIFKRNQEKREGPHSPSMAENIASTAKASEEQVSHSKNIVKGVKNLGNSIFDIVLFLGSMIVNAISSAASMVGNLLGGALNLMGLGGVVKGAKGLLRKGKVTGLRKMGRKGRMAAGKGVSSVGKVAGGLKGAAAARAAKGGGTLGKIALGTAKVGGKVAGTLLGGAMFAGESLWDVGSAMINPEGFAQNRIAAGFGAFLGGTESGAKGAMSGALKYGGLGATIGLPFGPIGAAIGGAIGSVAGGILGFVGGKNISKAIDAAMRPIKTLAKAWWSLITFPVKVFKEAATDSFKEISWLFKTISNVVSFPLKFMKEGFKSIWVIVKYLYKKLAGVKGETEWIVKPFIKMMNFIDNTLKKLFGANIFKKIKKIAVEATKMIFFPFAGMIKAMRWVKDFIQAKLEKMPVIGGIFKKSFEVIKDINEGNLASKLEEALEGKKNPLKEDEVKSGSSAKDFQQILADEAAKAKDAIIAGPVKRSVFDSVLATQRYSEAAERIAQKMDENGKRTTAAIDASSKAMITNVNTSNSSNSTVNNNNSGKSGMAHFNGSGAANHLLACDLM